MPRARTTQNVRQTAAFPEEYEDGSGCLSGFMIIPLSVVFISIFLASIAWRTTPENSVSPAIESGDSPPQLSSISPIFTAEVQHWAATISQWAAASQLDPNLAATVMQIESCGDPRAISSAGAMGLFQVMPFHFHSTDDPYNPNTNAARGLAYLKKSLDTAGGDTRLALAGYNGGIGVIGRGEWTWPAQTKRYVQYGWPIYQDAQNGQTVSTAISEWHENYGASLCRQASKRLGLP